MSADFMLPLPEGDPRLDQGHWCPWHGQQDVPPLKVLGLWRIHCPEKWGGGWYDEILTEPCGLCGGSDLHDDNTHDWCWCCK